MGVMEEKEDMGKVEEETGEVAKFEETSVEVCSNR